MKAIYVLRSLLFYLGYLLSTFAVAPGDSDGRPLVCETQGSGTADSRCPSGDQGYPSFQSHNFTFSILVQRTWCVVFVREYLFVGPLTTQTPGGFCAIHNIDMTRGERCVLRGEEREQRCNFLGLRVPA